MGKEGALGQDPLGWIKAAKENKGLFSSETMNTANKVAGEASQPQGPQEPLKQPPPHPTAQEVKGAETPIMAPPPVKTAGTGGSIAAQKPRVVIGRLYEKPSADKARPSVPRVEGASLETRRPTSQPFPVVKATQPVVKSELPQANRVAEDVGGSRFSTYIVIAYTALMLILGYLVYDDLSKRTSRLEARILSLEKALHAR